MGDKAKRPTATLSMLEGRKPGPSENRRIPKEFQDEERRRRQKKAEATYQSSLTRAEIDAMSQVLMDELLGHNPELDDEGVIGGSVPIIGGTLARGSKAVGGGLRRLMARFGKAGDTPARPQLAKEFAVEKVTKGGPGVLKRDVEASKAIVKAGGQIIPYAQRGGPLAKVPGVTAAKGAERVKVRPVSTEGPRVGPSGAPIQAGGKVQGQLPGPGRVEVTAEQIAALESVAAPAKGSKLAGMGRKLGKIARNPIVATTAGITAWEQLREDSPINFMRPAMRKILGPSAEDTAQTAGTIAAAREQAKSSAEETKLLQGLRAKGIINRMKTQPDPMFDADILEMKLRTFTREHEQRKGENSERRRAVLNQVGQAVPGGRVRAAEALALPTQSLISMIAPATDRGRESVEMRRELLRSLETGVDDAGAALVEPVPDDDLMDG